MSSALVPVIRTRFERPTVSTQHLTTAAIVVAGASFLALCAQVSFHVPWTPVPYTLQTFGVLVVGGAMGARLGVASVALYLAAGIAGLGVFADGGSGWAAVTSASGGYLIGFVLAAVVLGRLADRGRMRSVGSSLGAFLTAEVIVFTTGLLWLKQSLGVDAATMFEYGLYPFIPGEVVKLYAAGLAVPAASRLLARYDSDRAA